MSAVHLHHASPASGHVSHPLPERQVPVGEPGHHRLDEHRRLHGGRLQTRALHQQSLHRRPGTVAACVKLGDRIADGDDDDRIITNPLAQGSMIPPPPP